MRKRRKRLLGLFAGSLLLCVSGARADTFVSGTISSSTEWTLARSPYIVTGDVYVEGTATPVLTIDAGVTVKFNSGTSLYIGNSYPGGLQAVGTPTAPVVFTANTPTPTPGYWRSLRFRPNATASSRLVYATVSYGGNGYASYVGGINIESASPTIQNVTVQNNTYAGIKLVNGSPVISNCTVTGNSWGMMLTGSGSPSATNSTFSNNTGGGISVASPTSPSLSNLTFTNNVGFPISQEAGTVYGAFSNMTATGNTTNGVEIRGSTAAASTTWRNSGLPFIVTGDVYVEKNGTPVPVLTIDAGVTVKFNSGQSLFIGNSYPGELQAVGTATAPIVFTANTPTPTAGYWRSLRFRPNATASSRLVYAMVSYGGTGYASYVGGINIESASPTIQNVTLQNNLIAGIKLVNGSPAISGCTVAGNAWGMLLTGAGSPSVSSSTFSNNTSGGIWVQAPTSPSLSNLAFTNNVGFAISQEAGTAYGTFSNMTATGNTTNGVEVRTSTAAASTRWWNSGLPFIVTGDVYVEGTATPVPVLTIDAGVTVKFNAGTSLFIGNSYPGELQAVGTSTQPITFTANTPTPTAGYWRSLRFRPNATPTSRLAYATVSYGGVNYPWWIGAIAIESASPTIQNVTVQNNTYAGITVASGSPQISNATVTGNVWGLKLTGSGSPSMTGSTISSNTAGGIWIQAPSSPSLSNLTFTNNTGFPISQEAKTVYGTFANMTATGNTTNGVEIRPSTADASTTWRNGGIPYVVTGDVLVEKNGTPIPVLTIDPGVTVKFNAGTSLFIGNSYPGELQAVGTSTQPITFTANTANPGPGFWQSLRFRPNATPTSRLAYATVSYGGVNYPWWVGAIAIESASPTIQNVTVQNNTRAGISVSGGTPSISNSFISSNPVGVNIAAGNPLLFNCAFSANTSGIVNGTPTNPITAQLNYWDSPTGPSGAGPGSGQSISSGVKYEPWLIATPNITQYMTSAGIINRKFNPSTSSLGRWSLTSALSGTWTLAISNSSGQVVRTMIGAGTPISFTWDGKNDSGNLQPDGKYSYLIQTSAANQSSAPATGFSFLDSTLQVTITAPGVQTLSNVYQNGATDISVIGTVTMENLTGWVLDYGLGATPASWTVIVTGTQQVANSILGTWATLPVANGLYSLRLTASDNQGNSIQAVVMPTVGNFKVSENALQLSVPAGNTVTYTSIVPFSLAETLVLKNAAGQVVRTLVSGAPRAAGTFPDVWNGRSDSGGFLADGPYFHVATVTDGIHTLIWDQTGQYYNDWRQGEGLSQLPAWDPFNNRPLTLSYNFPQPGRVNIALKRGDGGGCAPPSFCISQDKYEESGPHTVTWAGVDGTGALRFDLWWAAAGSSRAAFSKNAIVLFGTKPSVTNVTVTPAVYGPAAPASMQTVAFDLATFQNQSATVTITFLNQASLSVLRTLTLTGQSPGHKAVTWDGRAENGMWVAPGFYTVTVSATDSLGNQVQGQILTTIQY